MPNNFHEEFTSRFFSYFLCVLFVGTDQKSVNCLISGNAYFACFSLVSSLGYTCLVNRSHNTTLLRGPSDKLHVFDHRLPQVLDIQDEELHRFLCVAAFGNISSKGQNLPKVPLDKVCSYFQELTYLRSPRGCTVNYGCASRLPFHGSGNSNPQRYVGAFKQVNDNPSSGMKEMGDDQRIPSTANHTCLRDLVPTESSTTSCEAFQGNNLTASKLQLTSPVETELKEIFGKEEGVLLDGVLANDDEDFMQVVRAGKLHVDAGKPFISSEDMKRSLKLHSLKDLKCTLHLIADSWFLKNYEHDDKHATIRDLIKCVQILNVIYMNADFDGNNKSDHVGFIIDEIDFWDPYPDQRVPFPSTEQHLLFISNHSRFLECAVVVFTYADYGGSLGIAWVGSHNFGPGMCSWAFNKRVALVNGNLGGKPITLVQLALNVAHEVGHLFGSLHDSSENELCSPDPKLSDVYLLTSFSLDGSRERHFQLSPCSRAAMRERLRYFASIKICIIRSNRTEWCGNFIKEEGEECDCGPAAQCVDSCCDPRTCRLKSDAVCSPVVSPCCSQNCSLWSSSDRHICRRETECTEASYCDGKSLVCPFPEARHEGRKCNNITHTVCRNGFCRINVCQRYGLQACHCVGKATDMCRFCCKRVGEKECKFANSFPELGAKGSQAMYLPETAYCNGDWGVCNRKHECKRKLKAVFWAGRWYSSALNITLTVLVVVGFTINVGLWVKITQSRAEAAESSEGGVNIAVQEQRASSGGRGVK